MTTYTLSQARKHFPELVEKSHELFEEYVISRKGIPTAVIVDYDFFEGLKETLNIVLDKKLVKRLRKAREEVKAGAGKNWKDLRKELDV